MENVNSLSRKFIVLFLAGCILQIVTSRGTNGQYPGINESIAKHRMGELIVKARPGDQVAVQQLKHEFWFGCAIANSLAGGRISENDLKQYKEKFLENFNSAVTENAVKWGDMERGRGEVNYNTVDGIRNCRYRRDLFGSGFLRYIQSDSKWYFKRG